jgi:two-component system, NarL family, response regulator
MPLEREIIHVLIVGDNAGLRDGIRAIINGQLDMVVAGEATNCEEAIQKFKTVLPDIVIVDVNHPVVRGAKTNMRILSQVPQARVIVISVLEGHEWIRQAFKAGVRAVLYQDMLRSELLSAIRVVHDGQRYIPKAIAMRLGIGS